MLLQIYKEVGMKILSLSALIFILLLLFTGCPYGYRYDEGKFPSDPVNIGFVNSVYNDYNMSAPTIDEHRYLYFSSDRNSYGADYDVVGGNFYVEWDKDKGTLRVDDRPSYWQDHDYADSLLFLMNDDSDQLGPYSLPYRSYMNRSQFFTDVMIYADDRGGDLDIMYVAFRGEGEHPKEGEYSGPEEVAFLNTASNEAYLAFWGSGFLLWEYGVESGAIEEVYFCSDRDGDYDIYDFDYPKGMDELDFLRSNTAYNISPTEIINSEGQDKCPYINGSLLVFASDRAGGYGGFDLYYSTREGSGWSEPRNFGERINTEYDEYRPIAWFYGGFDQDLMLFSSNRPGGKGGFDLYYVGITGMVQ